MSGRDLLYKPQVPILTPDDVEGTGGAKKLGVKPPPKEIGAEATAPSQQVRQPAASPELDARTGQQRPRAPTGKPGAAPAYKAAYFNRDISGVKSLNQNARPMQALRGAEGASDLRKVVLPPARGIETPDPAQIRAAGDLMGIDGSFLLDLPNLLQRQSTWARAPGVTLEMLQERLAYLAAMVEARKQALARMARYAKRTASVTLDHARDVDGRGLDQAKDLADEAGSLIQRTADQAEGMHRRIAKALGIKR